MVRFNHYYSDSRIPKRNTNNKRKQPTRPVYKVVESKPKNKKKKKSNSQKSIKMSSCANHYALAVSNPFHPQAVGACIPTFPARRSQKVAAKTIVNVAIGSAGYGWIAIAPTTVANSYCVYHTVSAFTGDSIVCNGVGQVAIVALSGLPYLSTDVWTTGTIHSAAVSGRIVSVGMRSVYTGTNLNMGGMQAAFSHPNHDSIVGWTYSTFTAQKECINLPVSRKPLMITCSAVDPEETTYLDSNMMNMMANSENDAKRQLYFPFSQGQKADPAWNVEGAPVMGIFYTGTPGNSFQVEIIEHVEYVGTPTNSSSTISHADIDGMSKVTNATGESWAIRGANPNITQQEAFASSLFRTLRDNQDVIIPVARAAANAGISYLRGYHRGQYRIEG